MRVLVFILLVWIFPASAEPGGALEQEYHRAWEIAGQLRFDEAIPRLQSIIATAPQYEKAYRSLGRAYCWARQLREGEAYFGHMAARDASDPLPHLGLLWLRLCTFDLTGAHRAAWECIQRSRGRIEASRCYPFLAHALEAWYGRSATPADFERQITPDWPTPTRQLLRASGAERFQRHADAVNALRKGLDDPATAASVNLQAQMHQSLANILPVVPQSSWAEIRSAWQTSVQLYRADGDRDHEIETLDHYALALAKSDPGAAIVLLQQAVKQCESWRHKPCTASSQNILALVYEEQGDNEAAIALFERAAEVFDAIQPGNSFTPYEHMGHCYRRLGMYEKAIQAYAAIGRSVPPEHALYSLMFRYLGDVYEETGDYWRALDHHQRSLAYFRRQSGQPGRDRIAATLIRIGRIYAALGDLAMAEAHFRSAQANLKYSRDPDPLQRVMSAWGSLFLEAGRPKEALHAFGEVRTLGLKTRNMTFEIPAVLGQGRAQISLGEGEKGKATLREALRLADQFGVKSLAAEAQLHLARRFVVEKRAEEARSSFEQALASAEATGLIRTAISAREGLAELAPPVEALEHLRAAVQSLEQVRNQVPGPNLRAAFSSQTWQIYQRTIRLLMAQNRRHPNRGFDREAFHMGERGRSRAFLDVLSEAGQRSERRLSAAEQQRRHQLTAAVSKAASELLRKPGGEAAQKVRRAEQELQRWISEVHASHPELAEIEYPRALDLAQVQEALPDDKTALISFVLDDPRSHAFVVSRAGLSVIPLAGQRVIEQLIGGLRKELLTIPKDSHAARAYEEFASRLYGVLVSPLRPALDGRSKLVIVPDGLLHYLPFEVLLDMGRSPRFLVEDFVIAYAPSASIYKALAVADARRGSTNRKALVAFADPRLDHAGSASAVRNSVVRNGTFSLGALPNTRLEVSRIGALYPDRERATYVGEAASEESVKKERLSSFRQVHFATHALVDERSPLRSGIVLATGANGSEDGLLTVAEIYNLEVNADLVVLSACQTGLGTLVRGEGLMGLTRAIFSAGASRVAVSLWSVNDVATAGLMEEFYKAMRSGADPASALRVAKVAMIRSAAPAWRHPYFWAPFIVSGVF